MAAWVGGRGERCESEADEDGDCAEESHGGGVLYKHGRHLRILSQDLEVEKLLRGQKKWKSPSLWVKYERVDAHRTAVGPFVESIQLHF